MALCGSNCCENCSQKEQCPGCEATQGHPFGGNCVAANCVLRGGLAEMMHVKEKLMKEINELGIYELKVNTLHLLNGFFVNLEYPLPNNTVVKFLNDNDIYWGNQIKKENSDRCLGIVANEEFILVCEYGCDGTEPEIVLYRKRNNE